MEWRCGLIQGKGKEIECWKQLNLPSGIPTKEAVVVMTVLIPSIGEESLLSFWMQIQKRMMTSPRTDRSKGRATERHNKGVEGLTQERQTIPFMMLPLMDQL